MTQTASTRPTSIWNEVAFTGNLGKDPDMHFTQNGTAITKFSLAVSQGKDKPPMWLNIETWKELAEKCNEKLSKGARVEVKGRMAQDVWEDKQSGQKRYALKVTAQEVHLIKRASGNASASGFSEEEDLDGADSLGDLDDHPF